MRKVIVKNDLVIGEVVGDGEGLSVSESLNDVPIERLRYVNSKVVDISEYKNFYLDENGFKHIEPKNKRKHVVCSWDDPVVKINNEWVVVDENIKKDLKWDDIRKKRNKLLQESDWSVLPDSGANKVSEWKTYRTLLRRIPQTYNDPDEVVWPVKPE